MGTLSYSYGKPYGYRHVPGTCRWCGDKLRPGEPGGAGQGAQGKKETKA